MLKTHLKEMFPEADFYTDIEDLEWIAGNYDEEDFDEWCEDEECFDCGESYVESNNGRQD